MPTLRSDIGPLATVFAFEAAARLGGFTTAAQELGVTQAAVSKQIAALEDRLGVALFTRLHRGVALTEAGQKLYGTTHEALTAIAASMHEIQGSARQTLTLALSTSLSRFWLIPLLPAFGRDLPGIALRILSQDEKAETRPEGADLLLRYGPGEDGAGLCLFSAKVRAMAAPAFLDRFPVNDSEEVSRAPRIHYDTTGRGWISWEDWRAAAGIRRPLAPPALSLSRYHDALVAAQQGQGIVLVWTLPDSPGHAVSGLVPVPGPEIAARESFYLVPMTLHRPETRTALDWFGRCTATYAGGPTTYAHAPPG